MKVKELMKRTVFTCGADDAMSRAAKLMWDHDCGAVVVVDDSGRRPVGILTDRDLCMATFTQDRAPSVIPVYAAMSRDVHVCRPDDGVGIALERMAVYQVRRLPVLDEGGCLVGLLSLHDVARAAAREELTRAVTHRTSSRPEMGDVGRALAAVCAPHTVMV